MEDKPKFMTAQWQSKLMRERPALFWLLATMLALPVLLALRLAHNGVLGGTAQIVVRVIEVCLLIGFLWLITAERRRRKERDSYIDAYLEQRYEQTHDHKPPSA